MRKAILLVTAVLTISLLSGCIDNKKESANTGIVPVDGTKEESKTDISHYSVLKEDNGTINTEGNSDWCVPGSKIMVQLNSGEKEFTVGGLTTFKGKEVCRAELVYQNGNSTRYYSRDGRFEAMTARASGKGDVYIEARSHARG